MRPIDWILVASTVGLVLAIGLYTQSYVKSVADFLSAGRLARRYLLAVGRSEMQAGAVVFVSAFEVMSHSGFVLTWWGWLAAPITLIFAIFGFVIYRYRETRAMTLGQFFEIRYSRRFRLFAGLLGFGSGLANFGIIPAVGARAMVYFLGLPTQFHLAHESFPTFIPVMALFLIINAIITTSGGILTILMTNCAEGILTQILFLVIIFGLLSTFSWQEISRTLANHPAGESFFNPFDAGKVADFNLTYVGMGLLLGVYGTMAWQNQSAYNSAPLNGHEARMGSLLGNIRGMGKGAAMTLLGICAYTYLHNSAFSGQALQIRAVTEQIPNAQIQEQMQMPIAVTHLLTPGIRGAFCAIVILGVFGGDSAALHSWGSLLVQDFILPLRSKAFTPRQHLRALRGAIAGVALFGFFFGIVYSQTEYIQMWFAVTQSIYVGGAGAAIIGGLYWKKGTTAGAWTALLTGSILSTGGILIKQLDAAFPLNGLQIAFGAMIAAALVYVVGSLLTCRDDFDMDRMLHRGVYAMSAQEVPSSPGGSRLTWGKIIGFDRNFTLGDKWIAGGLFGWNLAFSLIMIVGTAWNLISPWPLAVWSQFWHVVAIVIPIGFAVIIGIWFTWGSVRDSLDLFRRLRCEVSNPLDNGGVTDHQNSDESVPPDAVSPSPGKALAVQKN